MQTRQSSNESEIGETYTKRFYLDAVLKSQRTQEGSSTAASTKEHSENESPICSPGLETDCPPPQDNPIDLSIKSAPTSVTEETEEDEIDMENVSDRDSPPLKRKSVPIDLTTRS